MRKYNINVNLVRIIEQLYDKATSAGQMNGSIGEWFRATVRVRQGCFLSPTFFNNFLERIMSDALEARLAGKYRWREFPVVLGNTPNFGKVGNTGKYEIFEPFELKYAAIFP